MEIITFQDELTQVRDDFTHYAGMAIAAVQAGDVTGAAQYIAAAAIEFERVREFAQRIYEDTAERALCFNPAVAVVTLDDAWLLEGIA